jgi:hypothetical protein
MFMEETVVTLPGEVTVTPPKEVTALIESELSVGENGGMGTADIYDSDGKGGVS